MQGTQPQPQPPTPAPWPDGVIARYLTVAGATVDLRDNEDAARWRYDTKCTGCPHKDAFTAEEYAHHDAQAHAERCRALPRPGDAR
ncbi:hypothetical protein [Streptomyces tricolor]